MCALGGIRTHGLSLRRASDIGILKLDFTLRNRIKAISNRRINRRNPTFLRCFQRAGHRQPGWGKDAQARHRLEEDRYFLAWIDLVGAAAVDNQHEQTP